MIKSFEVKNLNNKISDKFYFNEDLNILTGKNGCGKTTILKTMWYIVSGNLDKIFEEVYFDFARLEMTNSSFIQIELKPDKKRSSKKIIVTFKKEVDPHLGVVCNYAIFSKAATKLFALVQCLRSI